MRRILLAGWLIGLTLGGAAPGKADEPFRTEVFHFEHSVRQLPEAERIPRIRAFFEKLKTPEEKLEAIGMTNSRYLFGCSGFHCPLA